MSLSDYIKENIVKPEIGNIQQQVKATVLIYDEKKNRATITFKDMEHTDGYTVLDDVLIQLGSGGTHSTGPYPGDEVIVNFLGGDIKRPVITSLVDSAFDQKTRQDRQKHVRKGPLLPDQICAKEDW